MSERIPRGNPIDTLGFPAVRRSMRPRVRIAVIVPVGPQDDILDTLASVVHYTDLSRIIVVIDDTAAYTSNPEPVRALSRDIVVLPPPPNSPGGFGGLWVKLAFGYRWVLDRYEPEIILRLDADALLIGRGLESCAERVFAENPGVGLLGSYRIGPDGGVRDWSWAAQRLQVEAGIRGLSHPVRRRSLRRFLRLARAHGYISGENVLGGAYIHSYEAAYHIYSNEWLHQPAFATSKLGEDHIMALITVAAGFLLFDFSGPHDPLAIKWRGLPFHPEHLLANKKLVTHSVRSWENLTEEDIRRIFKQARSHERADC